MTDAKKPPGRKQARKGGGSIYWDESKQCYFGSISLELIADLVGHANTTTTATVYRHQLRPVMTKGAELLDGAFAKGLLDAPETETESEP
jgi:hypothetical protein